MRSCRRTWEDGEVKYCLDGLKKASAELGCPVSLTVRPEQNGWSITAACGGHESMSFMGPETGLDQTAYFVTKSLRLVIEQTRTERKNQHASTV